MDPGEVDSHIAHAAGFCRAAGRAPESVADIGSGYGLPGLVVATRWPGSEVVLVERSRSRADLLALFVDRLGLGSRVEVLACDVAQIARGADGRGRFQLVTARSFGPPAVTAEAAAPLLAVGGSLIASDDPVGPTADRWPSSGLRALGMAPERAMRLGAWYRVVRQVEPAPAWAPRRDAAMRARPRF